MMSLGRRGQKAIARRLLILLAGVWSLAFVAPCVMAAPVCPDMDSPCVNMPAGQAALQTEAPACETLQAADCQLQSVDTLVDHSPSLVFHLLPVRLTLAPADAPPPRLATRHVDDIPPAVATPLYLRNATLLM